MATSIVASVTNVTNNIPQASVDEGFTGAGSLLFFTNKKVYDSISTTNVYYIDIPRPGLKVVMGQAVVGRADFAFMWLPYTSSFSFPIYTYDTYRTTLEYESQTRFKLTHQASDNYSHINTIGVNQIQLVLAF